MYLLKASTQRYSEGKVALVHDFEKRILHVLLAQYLPSLLRLGTPSSFLDKTLIVFKYWTQLEPQIWSN